MNPSIVIQMTPMTPERIAEIERFNARHAALLESCIRSMGVPLSAMGQSRQYTATEFVHYRDRIRVARIYS